MAEKKELYESLQLFRKRKATKGVRKSLIMQKMIKVRSSGKRRDLHTSERRKGFYLEREKEIEVPDKKSLLHNVMRIPGVMSKRGKQERVMEAPV